MKKLFKWLLILWSLFCIIGICAGMVNVAPQFSQSQNEYEQAGAAIGTGIGLGIWLIVWLALAAPALIIYLISGKKEQTKI